METIPRLRAENLYHDIENHCEVSYFLLLRSYVPVDNICFYAMKYFASHPIVKSIGAEGGAMTMFSLLTPSDIVYVPCKNSF